MSLAQQSAPPAADRTDVNEMLSLLNSTTCATGEIVDPPELRLQAVSTRAGAELLPGLMDAIDRASGWVLHRQMVSASALQLRLETQGRSLMDLYASLLEQGLELTRESHLLLTERCSCAYLHRQARGSIVTMHLDVTLPAEAPMLGHWWRVQMA